ncbi:hypothetical protein GCM10009814_24030 [Lapillicoccus jejuensis]|uniref:Glycosyltransferase involved in cell wall biosynthesis n=1 Tax=Lapillicoccus jejuensis TaxID=402171 RepID=A0A542E2Q8_9MICO|nr:glycosyltransferase involved in cell wall biosynthesis [Lapillicoccus jejuensis]
MRIVHAVDGYPPVPGGMEQAVEALAVAQVRAGHDVTVVSLAGPGLPAVEERDGVRVERVATRLGAVVDRFAADPTHRFHPTVPDPGVVRHLAATVRRTGADVLHAHGWVLASATRVELPPRTLLAHTLHDYGLRCATRTLVPRRRLDVVCPGPRADRCLPCAAGFYGVAKGTALVAGLAAGARARRRVGLFLPISDAVAATLPPLAPGQHVAVVPSAVADDALDAAAAAPRPGWLPDGDVVLFAGQLGEHKGVGLLARAHAAMRAPVPLVLVGAARADTPVTPGSADRPVVRVGPRPHAQVLGAMRAAAVVAVPSRWAEPLGLVAVEAMAAGTPVVASDLGGLADVVTAGTGLLVAPGDPVALAAALDGLLADPDRRRALGAAGPARARDFAASRVARRVLAAYDAARPTG